MSKASSEAARRAEEYYDGGDADGFYYAIWGGEDIHIGIYESDEEPIAEASHRTVERIASLSERVSGDARVLDLGAGYGGSARHLARTLGCRVECLNISTTQNERNEELNRRHELAERIVVTHGSFESVPRPDASVDVVWSQDAFLHSGRRRDVLAEVARVLAPEGELIFTDIMQTDDCPPGVLQPILDRIYLDTLGSVAFYRGTGEELGLRFAAFEDLSEQLPRHYARVLGELESRDEEMAKRCGRAYVDRMKKGLRHWVEAGRAGHLAWGILRFRKPA
jgi:sarcosine/dimethylglycine N-methyltransferase